MIVSMANLVKPAAIPRHADADPTRHSSAGECPSAYEQMRLVRKIRSANNNDFSMSCLVPFMTKRRLRGGQIVFRKNDPAGEMFMSPPCDCGSGKLLST